MSLFLLLLVTIALLSHVTSFRHCGRPLRLTGQSTGAMFSMSSSSDDLNALTVPELKTRLKAKGLTVGGVKKDLIERLLSSDDNNGSTQHSTQQQTTAVDQESDNIAPRRAKSSLLLKKVLKRSPSSASSQQGEESLDTAHSPINASEQAPAPVHASVAVSAPAPVAKTQPKAKAARPDDDDDFLSQLMEEGDEVMERSNSPDPVAYTTSSSSRFVTPSPSSPSTRGRSSASYSGGPVDVAEIQRLCDERNDRRYQRDYDGADIVRAKLEDELGVMIYDFKNEWVAPDGSKGPLNSRRQVASMHNGALEIPVRPAEAVPTTLTKEEINDLCQRRTVARRARRWNDADDIRDELAEKGVELFDKANEWRTFDGEMRGVQSADYDSYSVEKDRERYTERDGGGGGGGWGGGRGGGGGGGSSWGGGGGGDGSRGRGRW